MAEPNHLMDAWDKLVADCNRDPCYAGSWAGGLARRELEEWWERECPGLHVPQVLWSHRGRLRKRRIKHVKPIAEVATA